MIIQKLLEGGILTGFTHTSWEGDTLVGKMMLVQQEAGPEFDPQQQKQASS